MIQSVLSSIPIYFMSLFKLPKVVAGMLEKMMRQFLWEREVGGKGRSLVDWKLVCIPKERGGLGIGNLLLRNKALLGKWLWRFPLEQNSLWAAVIRSKYGLNREGWDTNLVTVGSFRSPWKFIAQVSYPRLFRLSNKQSYVVSQMYSRLSNNSLSWDFGFRRVLNDRESMEFSSLMNVLESVSLNVASHDARVWKFNSGIISFFYEKLNTCDRVQRKNPQMYLFPNRCVMCKKEAETADHLLLHCMTARYLWLKVLVEAGLYWDELVLTDQRGIVNEIVSFYENLYKETSTGWWDFEEIIWGSISVERAEWLERPFEEEEIKKAVFGCDREKSPGPDGFTGGFFQDCWDFLKDDIVKVLEEFYLNGKVCGNMNHTFLCLIPKKLDAQKVKDFRPISLVSGLYKILAKLLSNRLKEVLEEIISLAQGAFFA
ncbi:hypothetical protein UlMin_026239 [Ulmus minor]